jgi:rhodanese-related sulfurtransferase
MPGDARRPAEIRFAAGWRGGGAVIGIDSSRVRELLAGGAQLVEVLPEEEYREEHLPGAINIPLKRLDAQTAAALDRERPVIVYCWDSL